MNNTCFGFPKKYRTQLCLLYRIYRKSYENESIPVYRQQESGTLSIHTFALSLEKAGYILLQRVHPEGGDFNNATYFAQLTEKGKEKVFLTQLKIAGAALPVVISLIGAIFAALAYFK